MSLSLFDLIFILFFGKYEIVYRMTIQVGYWNIRGLIGGVRLMLEYAGADWNETFYEGKLKKYSMESLI